MPLPRDLLRFTSAAGLLPNLVCGISCFVLLSRKRSPKWLPFLIWGPVSMVQEGVTLTLGLLTPGGDAALIAAAGVPEVAIMLCGVFLLAIGIIALIWLLPTAGISPGDRFRVRIFVLTVGIGTLMAVRSAHWLLSTPESRLENLVPLIFSLLLTAIVVSLQRPISQALFRPSKIAGDQAGWPALGWSLFLGAGMFILQMLPPI